MTQLLQNAVYGTALILAVAILRRVLKDRLVPGAWLALWAVCLFRLLTPAAPESVLSLWGFFRPRQVPAVSAPAPMPAPAADAPQLYTPAQAGPSPTVPAITWETALLAVWLVVGAALTVRYALNWRRTRRAVACAIPVGRGDPRYLPLPRCARLREGPMEGAPLTFGVVRPTVVLSPGLEGGALGCVLAHEGVHASRRDNLWHYAMAAALIVHWWNPAVWLMARLLRRDIELSCDRAAVKKLGADRRAEYANALVSMATQESGPAFCQTFGRKAAEERILSVMKFKKTSMIGVVLSLALVLAVTVAFASAPKTPTDTVVYHGQTYNRADLSQETLDWLDWYLALPEEEQLAISMVPPELIPGLTQANYDMPAAGEDQPTYVDPDGAVDPSLREALEAAWYDQFQAAVKDALDESKAVNDYDVRFPADAIGGADSATGIFTTDPVPSAEPARGFDDYTIVGMDENGYPVDEQGNSLVFDENGELFMKIKAGYGPCIKEDCPITEAHYHMDGQVVPSPKSNAPTPVFEPDVGTAPMRAPYCPICTDTRLHLHVDGQTIPLADPCPVEGCTITGNHLHGDVCYSCNGAGHGGGHCDGSCYTYNTLPEYAPSSTSGHHGNGHH